MKKNLRPALLMITCCAAFFVFGRASKDSPSLQVEDARQALSLIHQGALVYATISSLSETPSDLHQLYSVYPLPDEFKSKWDEKIFLLTQRLYIDSSTNPIAILTTPDLIGSVDTKGKIVFYEKMGEQ